MATRMAAAVLLLVACSSTASERSPCEDELAKIVAPALERTLDGGDPEAFGAATTNFATTPGTMCGPDLALLIRDWTDALREPDAAKAANRRRSVLSRLAALVSDKEMEAERRALAGVLAKANAPAPAPPTRVR